MFSATASKQRQTGRRSASPGVVKGANPRKRAYVEQTPEAINTAWRRGLAQPTHTQSHAYGAPQQGESESMQRRRSLATPDEEGGDDGSTSGVLGTPDSQGPAARYAKYKQQPPPEQAVAGPSQPRPLPASYRPHEGGVQNTSVNLATVMRNHPLTRLNGEESLDPDTSHDTVPDGDQMQMEEEDPAVTFQGDGVEDEQDEDEEMELELGANTQSRGKKRKTRRSSEPNHQSRSGEGVSDESDGASERRKRPRKSTASADGRRSGRINGSARNSTPSQPNGIDAKRFLARDRTWAPGEVPDEGDESEPGEGIAPTKPRRSIDPRDYDETSSPELNGASYRLREPTDSTSFSQEEEIVDIEVARRMEDQRKAEGQRAFQEERMRVARLQREDRERQQMPPPPTPGLGTPHPPGRYAQTPAAARARRYAQDDDFDEQPPGPSPAPGASLGRIVEVLRSVVMAPFHFAAATCQELGWGPWRWTLAILLLAGMFGALTDQRAARGLWRIPVLHETSFNPPNTPPDSLSALMQRLVKLEQSQSSLTAQHSTLVGKRFSDKQDYDKRLDRLEEGVKRVDLVKLEKSVESLRGGLKDLSTDFDLERAKSASLDERLKAGQTEVRALKESVNKVMDAARADRIASQISEAIDKLLPSRLAVAVDPKTGKLDISRDFWSALHAEFVKVDELGERVRSEVSRQKGTPTGEASGVASWQDFTKTNEAELRRLLDQDIGDRISSGAILSKAAFRDLLEREVKSTIRKEFLSGINDKINNNVEEIASEMAAGYDRKQTALALRIDALEKGGAGRPILRTSKDNDVHSIVEDIVNAALIRHTKDVIARADYALYSAGARVVPDLTSPTYEAHPAHWWQRVIAMPFGAGTIRGRPPVVALHPDTTVGSCWSFAGTAGQLGVRLSRSVVIDAVVIEHAPAELAIDRRSAPADFEVWGEVTDKQAVARLRRAISNGSLARDDEMAGIISSSTPPSPNHVRLAAGRYDASSDASTHIQIFEALPAARALDLPISVVVLKILGLHGDGGFGCLYRFRALGSPSDV